MSLRETDSQVPDSANRSPTQHSRSDAIEVSVAASAHLNQPREREHSPFDADENPHFLPPPPDTEDEETESEIELEMDVDEEGEPASHHPTTSREAASPVRADAELMHQLEDDDSEEEEEDEAFPPVQRSPTADMEEETRRGEEEAHHLSQRDGVEDKDEEESEEDEETKAEDASDDEYRSAAGWNRPKTQVDVEADTELVRMLAAEAPRLAAATKKRDVWEDLVLSMAHRFKTWRAMQARYSWLHIVFRDVSHREHGHLTDEMKELMKAYNVVTSGAKPPRASTKRRTRVGFVDPARRRKMAHKEKPPLAERPGRAIGSASTTPSAETPSAGKKPPKIGRSGEKETHEKSSLDAVADEALLQAAVKAAPKFRTADDKMDVWNKIATESHGRYKTGLLVRHHIRWLVKLFRDATHPQHYKLTPALRELLMKFLDSTGQPLDATGPTTPRNAAMEKQAEREASRSAKPNDTPKKISRVTIRPKGDDMLVRLVLDKRPFAVSTTAAIAIWNEIAVSLAPTHPKITDGQTAHARFNLILKVFNNASHPNNSDFTKALKEKLSTYNQIMTSFRAKLSALKHKALQDDSSEASAEEVLITKPRALGDGAELPTGIRLKTGVVWRTSRSKGEVEATKPSERNGHVESDLENGSRGRKMPQPLNVQADELFMRVILEKRPWAVEGPDKAIAWNDVALTMMDKFPHTQQKSRISDGVSARERVQWLLEVLETPSHSDHNRITNTLRKMLVKYIEVTSKPVDASSELERKVTSDASSEDNAGSDQVKKKRKKPSTTKTKERVERNTSSPKRPRRVTRHGASNGKLQAKVKLNADDVLLQEALRARPFHSRRGDGMAMWDEVAAIIDGRMAEPTLRTGGRALARLKRLLLAHRRPQQAKDVRLTPLQSRMVTLVDELLRVKWPTDDTLLTTEHSGLQKRIQQFLDEKAAVQDDAAQAKDSDTSNAPETTVQATTAYTTNNININAEGEDEDDVEDDDDDGDDKSLATIRIVPRSVNELEELRRQLAEANRQCDALRVQLSAPTKVRSDHVNALQDEVIRLRTAAASDRASFANQLRLLEDELASSRAQLTAQTTRLESERREHRDELRTMIEMLQSERSTHERDTTAMLAVMNREREDRREDFVAMMNLVTRSVLPAEVSS